MKDITIAETHYHTISEEQYNHWLTSFCADLCPETIEFTDIYESLINFIIDHGQEEITYTDDNCNWDTVVNSASEDIMKFLKASIEQTDKKLKAIQKEIKRIEEERSHFDTW